MSVASEQWSRHMAEHVYTLHSCRRNKNTSTSIAFNSNIFKKVAATRVLWDGKHASV